MSKKVVIRFAEDIEPAGARLQHDPEDLVGEPRPYAAAFVYLQTTDAERFTFQYGTPRWLDETSCELTLRTDAPFALQAMTRVAGYGQILCRADNGGRLYDPSELTDGQTILFDVDAALSEIAACQKRWQQAESEGISIRGEIAALLAQARERIGEAQHAPNEGQNLQWASQALGLAITAHEDLVHQRSLYRLERIGPRPFSFSAFLDWAHDPFGPLQNNPTFIELYNGLFNTGAVSMFWDKLQPESPDRFDWGYTDPQFEFIRQHQLQGIGHCLGWTGMGMISDWVSQLQSEQEMLAALLRMTDALVDRYGDVVNVWTPLNEAHDWIHNTMTFEERLRCFRAIYQRLRETHSRAAVESDCCLVTSPYRMNRPDWKHGAREWLAALEADGISNYVVGLQLYNGGGHYAGLDMAHIADTIETYCALGHPIHLYAQTPGGMTDDDEAYMVVNSAWRGPWTPETQADWWERFLTLALSYPQVVAVTTVSLRDSCPNWITAGGLSTEDFQPKPAYHRIRKVLDRHTLRHEAAVWHPAGT